MGGLRTRMPRLLGLPSLPTGRWGRVAIPGGLGGVGASGMTIAGPDTQGRVVSGATPGAYPLPGDEWRVFPDSRIIQPSLIRGIVPATGIPHTVPPVPFSPMVAAVLAASSAAVLVYGGMMAMGAEPHVSQGSLVGFGLGSWLLGLFGFRPKARPPTSDLAVPSPRAPTLRELPPSWPVVVGLEVPTEMRREGSRVNQLRQKALHGRPHQQAEAIREMLELFGLSKYPVQSEILGVLSKMIAGGHIQAAKQVGEWAAAQRSHTFRSTMMDMLINGKEKGNPEAKRQLARLVPTPHQAPKERPVAARTPQPSPPPPPPQKVSPTRRAGWSESLPAANYDRNEFGRELVDPLRTRAIAARDRVLNNRGETAEGLKDLQKMVRDGNPHALPALIKIALWREYLRPRILDILVEIAGDSNANQSRGYLSEGDMAPRDAVVDALAALLGDVKLDTASRKEIVSALGRAAQTNARAKGALFDLTIAKSAMAPVAFEIVCSLARNGDPAARQRLKEFAKYPNHLFAAKATEVIARLEAAGADAAKSMTPGPTPGSSRRRTPASVPE